MNGHFGPPEKLSDYNDIDIKDINNSNGNNDSNNDVVSIVNHNVDQEEFSIFDCSSKKIVDCNFEQIESDHANFSYHTPENSDAINEGDDNFNVENIDKKKQIMWTLITSYTNLMHIISKMIFSRTIFLHNQGLNPLVQMQDQVFPSCSHL